jgi:multiple sugar transport system permease protein
MRRAALLFIAPAAILWIWWFAYPAIRSLILSFYDYNYIRTAGNQFVGLANYAKLFTDRTFKQSFWHSCQMVLVCVPVQTCLSLLFAVLLDTEFRGRSVIRTIFYAPYVISAIAVATVFMYLYGQDAPLTNLFSALFGLENKGWFANMKLALPLVMIMFVWQQTGFYMIMYLAGLDSIPSELNEAAEIDGANRLQLFFHITRPMLRPTTYLVVTYGIITAFQVFDQMSAIAGTGVLGSPGGALNTMVTFFYQNSFKYGKVGYGSAAVVVLFILIFTITLLQRMFVERENRKGGGGEA